MKAFSETDLTEDLMMFDFPTLFIHGDDEVYEGAPHGLCTTHKDRVNEDLFAFLRA